jgi:hypothetical protein
MADREYKINLTIASDASGAAPVDAGLKRVTDGAKQAEQALKGVEEQSKQTEAAVRNTGGAGSSGTGLGGGRDGAPLPTRVRSWHTPEEAAAIERMGAGMKTVASEAGAMEAATARAAVSTGGLAAGTVALGTALAAVAVPLFGAKKELRDLADAVLDLAGRFARASSEGVELPKTVASLTQWIKGLSAAAAEERGEEQKLANAKLDSALARQKVAMAAAEEKKAVEGVVAAMGTEIDAIDKREQRLAAANKTGKALEDAQFENERARLANSPGLSREERVTREADIERRQLEARQAREQMDLERQRAAEAAKLEASSDVLDEAKAGGNPAAISKAAQEEAKVRSQVAAALIRIKGEQERLEKTAGIERDTQKERSEAAIRGAREADSADFASGVEREAAEYGTEQRGIARWREQQKKQGMQSDLEGLRDRVLGRTGQLRGRFAEVPGVDGSGEALKLIAGVEQAARELERGGSTGAELQAFNDAMSRLAAALSKISPSLTRGLRDLRSELEPRLMRIEEEIGSLNAGSTR